MEGSPEIKILRSVFDYLVETISVDSVLPKARATGLITVRDHENCTAESTESKRAENFMKCVEKAVIANPGKFESFLSILDRCGQKSIAEYLRELNQAPRKVQESAGTRVFLPAKLKTFVAKLTDLEAAYFDLLAKYEAAVLTALGTCTSTQQDVFISTLQNMLDKEDLEDFRSGFKHLKTEITLLNIKYLKDTVKFLPEEEMRTKPDELLTSYEEKLEDFMNTTVSDYMEFCTEHLLDIISSSAEPVTMKISGQWREKTLKNLKMLTCELFGILGSRLHLHTITKGCVAVHWFCPISVIPALRQAIVAATDALQQEGILQIFIGLEAVMELPPAASSLEPPAKAPQLKILVCGRTGVGKSSLINSLFGRNVCIVGHPDLTALGPSTITTTQFTMRLSGIAITIFDSPGLQDGVENDKEYVEDMYRKCRDVDLVLYCFDMTSSRFTSAESRAISLITNRFGSMIWKHCIFVLTKANLVRVPMSMRQRPIQHHERIFKSFRTKILSCLKEAGVPESDVLQMVAAGNFNPEMTESIDPDRMILFASEQSKAVPGSRVDFIAELWVTCLETIPKDKLIHFLQATVSGGRVRNPTEDTGAVLKGAAKDVTKEVQDKASHDRIPSASFDLNLTQNVRTKNAFTIGSILTDIGAKMGYVGGGIVAIAGGIVGGVIGATVGEYLGDKDETKKE